MFGVTMARTTGGHVFGVTMARTTGGHIGPRADTSVRPYIRATGGDMWWTTDDGRTRIPDHGRTHRSAPTEHGRGHVVDNGRGHVVDNGRRADTYPGQLPNILIHIPWLPDGSSR